MRFQLALNVRDLDRAVAYYAKFLCVSVNKCRFDYANFAVDSTPIKLVLSENPDATKRLNHVSFEIMEADEVDAARPDSKAKT